MAFDLERVITAQGKVDADTAYRAINTILYSIDKPAEYLTYSDLETAFSKAGFTPLIRVNLGVAIHNDLARQVFFDPWREERAKQTISLLVQTFGLDEEENRRADRNLEKFFAEESLKNTQRLWRLFGGQNHFAEAMGKLSAGGGTEEERKLFIHTMARAYAGITGQDWRQIKVAFYEGDPAEIGAYEPQRDVLRFNTRSVAWLYDFATVIAAVPHEVNHRGQLGLAARYEAGLIPENHPDHVLAKAYALNLLHYQPPGNSPQKFMAYMQQLVERSSKANEIRFRLAAIGFAGLHSVMKWIPTDYFKNKVTSVFARGMGAYARRAARPAYTLG